MPQLGLEGMTRRQIQSRGFFNSQVPCWWLYVACTTSQPIVPNVDDDEDITRL